LRDARNWEMERRWREMEEGEKESESRIWQSTRVL
jgi:hypothetical protein